MHVNKCIGIHLCTQMIIQCQMVLKGFKLNVRKLKKKSNLRDQDPGDETVISWF